MSASTPRPRTRPAAGILVVDARSRRFALPALPGTLPFAALPVSAGSAQPAGGEPSTGRRRLGARSLDPRAFTDTALSAAHARLGLLFAVPATGAADLPPCPGLWGRAARHGLAPDREGLAYLGRVTLADAAHARWHVRLFAIARARAVEALFPAAPGGRTVWVDEAELESRLGLPELAPFIPLASRAAAGAAIRPLHVQNRAGRLRSAPL